MHWTVIYQVDSVIHLMINPKPEMPNGSPMDELTKYTLLSKILSFALGKCITHDEFKAHLEL